MDPEATDTNWKSRAQGVMAWIKSHPDIAIPVACFIAGAILGAVVFR